MYALLVFIFIKDLNATPLQITLLVSSKPLVALLSFYSNLIIKGQPHRLKSLIAWSYIIGCLPCLFFPFIDNVWFFLLGFAVFGMSVRAMIPAWSEVFKINLPKEMRSQVFSQGSITSYLVSTLVPLLLAPWMDFDPHVWRWLFFGLALVQVLNIGLTLCLQIKRYDQSTDIYPDYQISSFYSLVVEPWRNCWTLMHNRSDFRNFQIVFMFGGAGLMIMHPVLPVFFKQNLQLSYMELTLATVLCKSIAFALTSPIWARWMNRVSIHMFNFYVTLFAAIFAIFIIAADFQLGWLYLAYFIYGLMQAGSELSWNLSGPIFSKHNDSTLYTGVNVAMVGIRGAIAPFLGELIYLHSNAEAVFFIGGALCFTGSCYSLLLYMKERSVAGLVREE